MAVLPTVPDDNHSEEATQVNPKPPAKDRLESDLVSRCLRISIENQIMRELMSEMREMVARVDQSYIRGPRGARICNLMANHKEFDLAVEEFMADPKRKRWLDEALATLTVAP